MKENYTCRYESRIVKEAAREHQSEEIKAHLSACAHCQDSLKIARWMQSLTVSEPQPPRLFPAPGLIWWRAELLEKRDRARRARRLISWTQAAAMVIVLAAIMSLLIKNQARLAPFWNNISAAFQLVFMPLLVTLACGALIFLATTFRARSFSKRGD